MKISVGIEFLVRPELRWSTSVECEPKCPNVMVFKQAARAAPALLHGKTLGGLCRQFVGHVAICVSGFALRTPVFPFPQDGADAMDVPGHYSQRHVALEPVKAMIRTVIKTMDLQCVDR